MRDNTTTNTNNGTVTKKEVSLEELDVLCRQYNHLHDEEVLRIVTRFFVKIASFFKQEKHQHSHSTARQVSGLKTIKPDTWQEVSGIVMNKNIYIFYLWFVEKNGFSSKNARVSYLTPHLSIMDCSIGMAENSSPHYLLKLSLDVG